MNVQIYLENKNLEKLQLALDLRGIGQHEVPYYLTQNPYINTADNKISDHKNIIEVAVTPDEFRWLEDHK